MKGNCSICRELSVNLRKTGGKHEYLCPLCRDPKHKALREFVLMPRFAVLIPRALEHGVETRPHFSRNDRGEIFVSSRLVFANGRLCKFSVITVPSKAPNGRTYWHPEFKTSPKDPDWSDPFGPQFQILQVGDGDQYPHRFFIKTIEAARENPSPYISVNPYPSRNRNRRNPWLESEGHWDILGGAIECQIVIDFPAPRAP